MERLQLRLLIPAYSFLSKYLFAFVFCTLLFSYTHFQLAAQSVTKTFSGTTITVDGCGTFCSYLPALSFTTADFQPGATISDIKVAVTFDKTDGTCSLPTSIGASFHEETSFRIEGPNGTVVLANPGTWIGGSDISPGVTVVFDQGALPPFGSPSTGFFRPVGGTLNDFLGTDPNGTWALVAGDNAFGAPLCIQSYSITLTACSLAPSEARLFPGPPQCIDGSLDFGVPFGSVNFSPGDLPPGSLITDVNVAVTFDKTDGSCSTGAATGFSFHNETSFSIQGPGGTVILAAPDTWSGGGSISPGVTVTFDQGAPFPFGPPSNGLFSPSFGNSLDDFNGTSPFGSWTLYAGDNNFGNPLYVQSFMVIVSVAAPPTIPICPADIAVPTEPNTCSAVVSWDDPVATDFCGNILTHTNRSHDPGLPLLIGTTTVLYEFTDNAGNISTCDFEIFVADTEPPNAVCKNSTVSLDDTGNTTLTFSDVDGGSSENCVPGGVFIIPDNFNCANVGDNTVIYAIYDQFGGSDACTATVTIQDATPPFISCNSLTISLDNTGQANFALTDIEAGSSDQCGLTVSAQPNAFGCADIGTNHVTLLAEDVSGNQTTCISTITVQSNLAPTLVCQNTTVALNALGNAIIEPADIDGGTSDNCPFSLTVVPNTFGCTEAGNNQVTLTATNNLGSATMCTATVTVTGASDLSPTCQDITVALDQFGQATITVSDVNNSGSNNCGFTYDITTTTFDCTNSGDNIVTLTATDPQGNTENCVATVTVTGASDLSPVCQDIEVALDQFGQATITVSDVNNSGSNNCGFTYDISTSAFNCTNSGDNMVTLTATDPQGNTENCVATVTVTGASDLSPVCQDITLQLDETGSAAIEVSDINNSGSDNCGFTYTLNSSNIFSCADLGQQSATLTAADPFGSNAICTATITITDNVAPSISCPSNIETCQLDGFAVFDDPVVSDNCPNLSTVVTPPSGSLFPFGISTVTATVTDVGGNTNQCTFTVAYDRLEIQVTALDYDGFGVSCFGAMDGEATATPTSPNFQNLSFLWSDGQTTQTAVGLGAGIYTVQAFTNNGCIAFGTVFIEEPEPPFSVTEAITGQVTFGSFTLNTFEVMICDGSGVYNLDWEQSGYVRYSLVPDGAGCSTLTILYAGNASWSLTITDELSNCDNGGATLLSSTNGDVLSITNMTSLDATDCSGLGDGEIGLTVQGGTPPYNFVWDGPSCPCPNAATITNLVSGWYDVVITDSSVPALQLTETYWIACCKPGRPCNTGKTTLSKTDESLLSISPNPFSQNATLEFLPMLSEQVNIAILSTDGKLMDTVFEGAVNAEQLYSFSLSATSLSTGLYICRLSTQSGAIIYKRVVVVK